ncbi:MAG: glycine betaine ABC transporter substrate-binding protein, partial [Pseudomonadota bacterium]
GPVNGQFLHFPEPEMACFRDPDWGPNPDVTGDCGDPSFFAVSKAAWSGALDGFPKVWPILQAVSFDATDFSQVVAWMDEPGAVAADVATRWIDANAVRAHKWLRRGYDVESLYRNIR